MTVNHVIRCDAGLDENRGATRMSKYQLELLRERVATRFYDRPEIIDELARAMIGWGVRQSS